MTDIADGGEKLLLFGGLPHKYLEEWAITSDLKLVEEKIGVQFEEVQTEELAAKYLGLSGLEQAKAKELARQLTNKMSKDRRARPLVEAEIKTFNYVRLEEQGKRRNVSLCSLS